MNWPLIKVCGIQTPAEGLLALENKANSIGLLIGLTHKALDKIDIEQGVKISLAVRERFPLARIVLVTHLLDPAEVQSIVERVHVTAIQIHDDMPPDSVAQLRRSLPGTEIFKTIHIEGTGDAALSAVIAKAQAYAPHIDAFFTDSKTTDTDGQVRIGGTGKRHDAQIARRLIAAFPTIPVILAGGLNPENVAAAIEEIRPAGIDANSGLENPDGSKNAQKILTFAQIGKKFLASGT